MLDRGGIAGLEICKPNTNYKCTLVSALDFTVLYKLNRSAFLEMSNDSINSLLPMHKIQESNINSRLRQILIEQYKKEKKKSENNRLFNIVRTEPSITSYGNNFIKEIDETPQLKFAKNRLNIKMYIVPKELDFYKFRERKKIKRTGDRSSMGIELLKNKMCKDGFVKILAMNDSYVEKEVFTKSLSPLKKDNKIRRESPIHIDNGKYAQWGSVDFNNSAVLNTQTNTQKNNSSLNDANLFNRRLLKNGIKDMSIGSSINFNNKTSFNYHKMQSIFMKSQPDDKVSNLVTTTLSMLKEDKWKNKIPYELGNLTLPFCSIGHSNNADKENINK